MPLALKPISAIASTSRLALLLLSAFLVICPTQVEAVNGRPSSGTDSNGACSLDSLSNEAVISGLRIASIFIVLISSTLGVTLPFLPQLALSSSTSSRTRRFWDGVFFTLKYAGAGVIIATAFVHLTYEAFIQLSSPCITLAYEPLAPVLAMASLSLVFIIDCFLTRYLHRLRKRNAARKLQQSSSGMSSSTEDPSSATLAVAAGSRPLMMAAASTGTLAAIPPPMNKKKKKSNSNNKKEESYDLSPQTLHQIRLEEHRLDEKSRELEVMVIEGGIVFHSIMVGLGLGTSTEEGFVPYFVAITFHQFFDGCAIGTRMALLDFVGKRRKQFAMFAAYGLVTPLGIAIGVGVRNTFQPNDPNTILVIGILDSLSAGVLLYGALVNLLAKDFLTGEMLDASNLRLGGALLSMFVGAALMSLLGQWA